MVPFEFGEGVLEVDLLLDTEEGFEEESGVGEVFEVRGRLCGERREIGVGLLVGRGLVGVRSSRGAQARVVACADKWFSGGRFHFYLM